MFAPDEFARIFNGRKYNQMAKSAVFEKLTFRSAPMTAGKPFFEIGVAARFGLFVRLFPGPLC